MKSQPWAWLGLGLGWLSGSLGSGRRVKGREAIRCDAYSALEAAAVTRDTDRPRKTATRGYCSEEFWGPDDYNNTG